jgi:hypothetical protein
VSVTALQQQVAGIIGTTVSKIQEAVGDKTVVVPVIVVLVTGNMFAAEKEFEFGGSAAGQKDQGGV